MTQQEFNDTKKWLETNTGLEFDDREAALIGGVAIFNKTINADSVASVALELTSEGCTVYLYDPAAKWYSLEICRQDYNNAHLCAEVFAHIINYNN